MLGEYAYNGRYIHRIVLLSPTRSQLRQSKFDSNVDLAVRFSLYAGGMV
jgi:hypothetical protein